MTEYVCGFLFSPDRKRVVLIRKNRPEWQAGRLNGVGGKIEEKPSEFAPMMERPEEAMEREFREECGVAVDSWHRFASLTDQRGWIVYFFYAFGHVDKVRAITDEIPIVCPSQNLPDDVLPNLRWLIPMALSMKNERADAFMIREYIKEVV